jgi:regulator of protease activity HflC (stomatin/prohibitin superfamily)
MILLAIAILLVIAAFIAAGGAVANPKDRAGWSAATGALFLLAIAFLVASTIRTVDTGHVGIRVVFNDVKHDGVLRQGWHFQPPWVRVVEMNIRTQKFDMIPYAATESGEPGGGPVRILSRDAGQLTIDATVNYRLDPAFAAVAYETLGIYYAHVVFLPAARASLRDAAAGYIAVDAATTQRELLAADFRERLASRVNARGIVIEQVNVRSIDPSDRLKAAIDEKLATQQEVERAEFRRKQAVKDAEILRVEAAGIRDAQEIIRTTLSDEYLRWHYQQVLKDLVGSPNNTVLVLPQDQSLSPLINVNN